MTHDELNLRIEDAITEKNNELLYSMIDHWDTQDTDNDGAIECYFYMGHALSFNRFNEVVSELAKILGKTPSDATISGTYCSDGEIRIDFIVQCEKEIMVSFLGDDEFEFKYAEEGNPVLYKIVAHLGPECLDEYEEGERVHDCVLRYLRKNGITRIEIA